MKFLVIGLGSMGKRRIRCLEQIDGSTVIGHDVREDRCAEAESKYSICTFSNLDEAIKSKPDAFIISTPPDRHFRFAKLALSLGKPFFIEASVLDSGFRELADEAKRANVVAAPSSTMRFHPAVKIIKQLVEEKAGRILSFTHHFGQYLPDWHPWEDIGDYYVSNYETGGCRELVPFELVWLTWLFGDTSMVSCFKDCSGSLDTDIDDIYQIILKFNSGVIGHLLVDVLERQGNRSTRIIGTEGTIEWSADTNIIRFFNASKREWHDYSFPESQVAPGYNKMSIEAMYVDEIKAFVNAIAGESEYSYSLEDDLKILNILYSSEESSETGKHISTSYHD